MATQDDYIRTALRLPRDLHAAVQWAAEAAGRSMNAEIIEIVRRSVTGDKLLNELMDQFDRMREEADAERAKAIAAYQAITARMESMERTLSELVAKIDHRL